MARHNDLIGHNTSPDRNKPNPSPNRPHAAEPTRKALVTRESGLIVAHRCERADYNSSALASFSKVSSVLRAERRASA